MFKINSENLFLPIPNHNMKKLKFFYSSNFFKTRQKEPFPSALSKFLNFSILIEYIFGRYNNSLYNFVLYSMGLVPF